MNDSSKASINIELTRGAKVMIIDDNPDLLRLISLRLKSMEFEVKTLGSAIEALSVMSVWLPDIIITDLQMPKLDGMEFFNQIHGEHPLLPVIILTAHGTIPDAVKATQNGVASFLTKPFDGDELITEIHSTLLNSGFIAQNSDGTRLSTKSQSSLEKIDSKSPKMIALLQELERIAPTNTTILLEGEIGSGKDELAQLVHRLSNRSEEKLVHVSAASLPDILLQAEVFGRIGNGTPDKPERAGALNEANNGTLVISDFNEADPKLIYQFLHCMVNKKVKYVDQDIEYSFDCRLIATTSFVGRYGKYTDDTWDFWDKLEISGLTVPALRERREDIPLIANQCLNSMDKNHGFSFANKAIQLMLTTEWPGNVRQLISVVKQCARLCNTKIISESLVNSRLSNPVFKIQPLSTAHRNFERDYLTDLLKATNGNVTKASEMARRNRTEFHRLLKKHKIEAKSFRSQG